MLHLTQQHKERTHDLTLPQINYRLHLTQVEEGGKLNIEMLQYNITSDVTNKRNGLALNGGPGLSSSWFVTVHITSDITNKKRGGQKHNIAIL
jgi:carboxypeptidase C (cathepsin A)